MSTTGLKESALDWARDGWFVFPVVPGTKIPLCPRGHHEATTDEATINRWWTETPDANIGCVPGLSGACVIDLDPPDGAQNWADLCASHGGAPTYYVRTPRGGIHLYYIGHLPPSTGKLGPHIDVRGDRSYVLLAPSHTADGAYAAGGGEIAPLPGWVEPALAAARVKAQTMAAPFTEDEQANVLRGKNLLASQPALVVGQNSDEQCFILAAKLRELGLGPGCAADLIAGFQPDFDPDWVVSKVANAFNYAGNAPGIHAGAPAAETFKDARLPKQEEPANIAPCPNEPVNFAQVFGQPVEPVREIIEGLVERGIVNLLSAPGGHYKSTLGLQWGLCVAAGLPVFGRPVEQCTFLHLSYEDDRAELNRRGQRMQTLLALPSESPAFCWDLRTEDHGALLGVGDVDVVELPFWARLKAWLMARPGHKFVLADSAYDILLFASGARINEDQVRAAIRRLDALCAECDCTLLALYHPTRAGAARGDAGNSPAWDNTPRSRLSLSRLDEGKGPPDVIRLRVDKRNHGPQGAEVILRYTSGAMFPETVAHDPDGLVAAMVIHATKVASQGTPFVRAGSLPHWLDDVLLEQTGRRFIQRTLRDALETACYQGLLCYRHGGKEPAGYYAPVPAQEVPVPPPSE